MKTKIIAVALVIAGSLNVLSQGFVNLNFENTTILPAGSLGFATATMQGWIADRYTPGQSNSNNVPYNVIALDSPAVDIQGTNSPYYRAVQGLYSVLLQGGSPSSFFDTNGASISQTGQVPVGTQSIMFWGYFIPGWGNSLQVTFNDQPLSFFGMGVTTNHTVYAADISAFAGQTGSLAFSVAWESELMIDNIQFSTSPIPEPNAFALIGIGTIVFVWSRKNRIMRTK